MRDIFDTHVHCLSWEQRADDIVAQMDEFGIRMECVIAPPIWYENREALNTLPRHERREAFSRIWREKAPAANDLVAGWAREKPERILALAWIDPLHPEAPREVERAVENGCAGVKIINIGHYPWDERCFPVYDRVEQLDVPILFHTGILGDGRNSRYSRPAEFEVLKEWPGLRCILAHMGWPWTDEAIATIGMGRLYNPTANMVMDIAPGAPLAWREDALEKALGYLPPEWILFGTDGKSTDGKAARVIRETDYIFKKLRVAEEVQRKIYWENAAAFWSIK